MRRQSYWGIALLLDLAAVFAFMVWTILADHWPDTFWPMLGLILSCSGLLPCLDHLDPRTNGGEDE